MEPSDIVLLILAVLCPPGSVALKRGLNREFIICMGLTLLFWVPGIAFSWYLIFKYPLANFRRRGSTGQYHTIEDGLRRHSLTSTAGSGDDSPYRSEEDDSRSTTMTSETAAAAETAAATAAVSTQPEQSLQRHLSSGRSKKHRRARKSSRSNPSRGSTSNSRSSSALQEAARNYAMRQQQRQQSNSVKKWFVDHFYFADPTQVPPSSEREPLSNEQHELSSNR
ncbi:hypothetical protein LPJ64_002226 [Coemansia asiatica]|uniref:Uncharacterized protein n=1 Tax=Coemansia asiatica TaxID=1052880 RepID=A0A9W8CJ99_9FUNG|nr:hypothetical protein LPJ64_002226 [Coemansia asiatica]